MPNTRSYDTLLDIDRASTGCVRLRTSAGYFPKLVKEKIKDRSISIRLAPSILIPVPLPPPRAAFVFPSYVYPPTMFMSVFFGMPAVKRARAFVHCELLIAREHLSPWINSLCYVRVLTRGYGIAFSQSDNRAFIVLVFHSLQVYKLNECRFTFLTIIMHYKKRKIYRENNTFYHTMCAFKKLIFYDNNFIKKMWNFYITV